MAKLKNNTIHDFLFKDYRVKTIGRIQLMLIFGFFEGGDFFKKVAAGGPKILEGKMWWGFSKNSSGSRLPHIPPPLVAKL